MSVQTDPLSDSIDALNGTRYDWLLVAIPLPLLIGWAVGALLPVATPVGLGLGAVPAALLVCYALFVDAPIVGPDSTADVEPRSDPAGGIALDGSGADRRAGSARDGRTGPVPGSDD